MNKKATRIASLAGLVIAAVALSGCSLIPAIHEKPVAAPSEQPEALPDDTATEEPADDTADAAGTAVAGDLVQPGQTVAPGDWATYPFLNYDGKSAVLTTKLVSVEAATQAQTDLLVSEIPDLKGWNVVLIRFQEQKASGDDITYSDNSNDFVPADVNGRAAQVVSVIGWDDCTTNYFDEGFNAGTTVLDECIVGAYVNGGDPVTGMIWTGNGADDDNPFSEYDGKPVWFTL